MILPDFVLPSRINQLWEYSGIDSLEHCLDAKHFKQYAHAITYNYNSRGFRDQEWPEKDDDLKNAIWCIGDSFTVGIGSPIEHIWPGLLHKQTGQRTINVSMDGASNNWISRKAVDILQIVNPKYIVIHWSYSNRREADWQIIHNARWKQWYQDIKDPSWPEYETDINRLPDRIQQEILAWPQKPDAVNDEDLRLHYIEGATAMDDLNTTISCIDTVHQASKNTKVIHSFIPEFCQKSHNIQQHLIQKQITYIPEFSRLDLARDGHHYDIKTSQYFVNQIIAQLQR
jgi:hypothetical protein